MYRSLPSSSDSLFSLDRADDSEVLEDVSTDYAENGTIFPDLIDSNDGKRVKNLDFIVADANSDFGLHSEWDLDSVNPSGAGRDIDNEAKVKDSGTDYQYLYADDKQDLDFFNFQAHIHKTSSSRDLAEAFEEESVYSMAPVITVTPPMSPPPWQTVNVNNLPSEMLNKKSHSRGRLHSSGYSTPSDSVTPKGSLTPSGVRTPTGTLTPSGMRTPTSGMRTPTGITTPSGMQTPIGMRTPTGSMTPTGQSPPSGMKKSSSTANLIHFHNLEDVSIFDLYPHPNSDHHPIDNSPINLNISHDREAGKQFGRSFQRNDRSYIDKKYKSHSCPHSRHHSPPRQLRHRIETVNEADSLPDIVTASAGTNGNVDLKDINFNDMEDIKIINEVDDNLTAVHEEDQQEFLMDGSYPRQRSEPLSFAALFHRCRYERDTSVPNTPYEGDSYVVDPEQLMNRVNYSILCAERVSQMTKTYNDIEAVTRLLEEKERDLELAARIGQTLLSKNKELGARSETLEEQLAIATEKVNQLHHEVVMKDELLRFYKEDLEHEASGDTTPNDRSGSLVNVDFLEKKVKTLEDENLNLRLESAELKSETEGYEEKEKRLVEDCIQQLADVNLQVEALAEELHQKVEENTYQKEQITGLLAQIADLQTKIRKCTNENMEMHEKLAASMESQRKMTKDLGSMQDKYDELLEMLEEAQEELRAMRGKHKVRSSGQHHHSAYAVPTDSLASELETSLQQELSQSRRRSHNWKVFETARAAKRAAAKAAEREKASATRMSLGAPILQESDSLAPSAYPSDVESLASDGYSADMDSLYGSNPELGQPGIPGSNDLESALKRLAMRRANEQNERDFHEDEEERRRKKVQAAMSGGTSPYNLRSPAPYTLRSPSGSVSSSNWSTVGMSTNNNHHYKFSEKLQIVKPMEGSMTLRHWQHLATPHLGGIFEERDGVQIKGEKKLDLVEEIYSLSDFEEDDDANYVNTHKEQDLDSIYTYTDSTISDPSSYRGQGNLFASSTPVNAHMNTGGGDDYQFGNSDSQSTQSGDSSQSMSLGLGSLLQGRENTEVGLALMRVSALKRAATTSEPSTAPTSGSTLDINQKALASRGFANHTYLSSLPRNIPGSRSFDQAMREYEEKRKATAESKLNKKPELFAPGMTGKGFLQQLKSKGYSLYGLWGGGAKDSGDSSADGAGESSKSNVKTASESVFSNGAGVGVLGALTNFRRNGMF